jgi:formylglycine-generating enzyme required for sulfatase activity
LSRLYHVSDAQGERRLSDADLPLCLGGTQHGDVVLPQVPAAEVTAYIAESDGHAYIQPAEGATELFHNHERFSGSRWLKSGDRLQLGEALLDWRVQGDQVFISVRHRKDSVPVAPPQESAPAAAQASADLAAPLSRAPEPPRPRRRLRRLVAAAFVLLVLAAAFVLLATPVSVRVTPEAAPVALSGFPPPVRLGERWLALAGSYRVSANHAGYAALQERIDVPLGGFRKYHFDLQALPGRVTIQVDPEVAFRLFVDDTERDTDSAGVALIEKGSHRLRVETERYLPESQQVEIAGLDQAQSLVFRLQPGWADVTVVSEPPGAQLSIDGAPAGVTPVQTEVMHGPRRFEFSLARHKTLTLQRELVAGSSVTMDDIRLQPEDGRVVLHSEPAGASVSVAGQYLGLTPVTLSLASGAAHSLKLNKAGYQGETREIMLQPGEQRELSLALAPQYGVVFVAARPADAELLVDGKVVGMATRRLRLPTRPHVLEFRKAGYAPQRKTVTPRAGVSQNLEVTLKTEAQAKADATPATITTAAGQRLRLVLPQGSFHMGASRREAGRRANESQRLVRLTRPFYLGENEVSNAEFRRFRPGHDSGAADGARLNGDAQPVVNVSWDDAARYCNWLSARDGLPAAYREQGGQMQAVQPPNHGYRMPSEAEWVYVARVLGRKAPARYPWSGAYPPRQKSGNFADARIADVLANVVPGYDDGYRGSAPVGSFAARPQGFHDLGGNVAEWVNDYYAVYPGEAERLVNDPRGPASGEHRVVRDSSWRHGSITELRLSYRDYSREARSDLGFRIARSVD